MAPQLAVSAGTLARNQLSEIFNLAMTLRAQGASLIDLSIGEPSFDTPDPIRQAGIEAIQTGHTKYTNTDGTPALKAAVIDKYQRQHGICLSTEQIVADAGAKPTLSLLLSVLLDAGDRVVTTLPCYSCYFGLVSRYKARFDGIETGVDQGFRLLPDQLSEALRAPAKVWLLNNPCNPTGVMYRADELAAFAQILRQHPDLWIVIDEVYEYLNFDDQAYVSLAAVAPDLQHRIISVNSVSKTYAMTGWRLGYAVGALAAIQAMRQMMDVTHTNPCSITQAAAVAALNGSHAHLSDWCDRYRQRRDLVTRYLDLPDLVLTAPQAGMFHFIHCGGLIGKRSPQGEVIHNSSDWVTYLLQHWQVVVVPGQAFGLDPYFRISMVAPDDTIEQGCQRIAEAVRSLT